MGSFIIVWSECGTPKSSAVGDDPERTDPTEGGKRSFQSRVVTWGGLGRFRGEGDSAAVGALKWTPPATPGPTRCCPTDTHPYFSVPPGGSGAAVPSGTGRPPPPTPLRLNN